MGEDSHLRISRYFNRTIRRTSPLGRRWMDPLFLVFSSIPGFCPLKVSSSPVLTTSNVSGHRPVFPRVQTAPGGEPVRYGGIFWKTPRFCHLKSANWDEFLLCCKGHLSKYRACVSLGPHGAPRRLRPWRAQKARVRLEWTVASQGRKLLGQVKESPVLSPVLASLGLAVSLG